MSGTSVRRVALLAAAGFLMACSPAPATSTGSSGTTSAPSSSSAPSPSSTAAAAASPTTCRDAFVAGALALTDEAAKVIMQLCGSVDEIEQVAAEFPGVLGDVDIRAWVQDRCTQFPELGPTGICGFTGGDIPTTELEGKYTTDAVGVDVSFEVKAPGWVGIADVPGAGFGLNRAESEGAISVVPFPGEVFSDPCKDAPVEPLERSADAFINWIAAHPELKATAPVETTLGGHPALQVDVTADVGEPCPDSPRIWLWVLPIVRDFHVDEDEAARFIAADVGGTTVVTVIETFDMTKQADLLAASEPVLESMVITP